MRDLVIPRPNEKQRLFLKDEHRYVAYGGARGGGKSWAVRVKAVELCLRNPGIKVMIVRRTYPELQENHIVPLCEMLRVNDPDKRERIARYNDQKKTLSFANGSRILFRYCENERDSMRFQGTEVDVLFIDEATHQSEEQMQRLKAIVRGVNQFPKRIYLTCNPGGPGHAWVKRLFIDRHFKDEERAEDYNFIQAKVQDNTALMKNDPEYIQQLRALPPRLRAAWLEGRWDVFEGQFFEDFCAEPDLEAAKKAGFKPDPDVLREERRFVHVIEPFDLNAGDRRGWTVVRSYDFGYGRPFSCAWWAVDYDGVIYRVLELYGCTGEPNVGVRWSPDKQFEEIARIEREHPWLRNRHIDGVADPSIWDASRGESIAETAARYRVWFSRGDNERIAGWMQCHYRLQFDDEGFPRMYVFNNCKAFLRTIPLMMHSKTRVEDLDTSLEDHVADEWRYLCMSRPITPLKEDSREPELRIADPLNREIRTR